MITSPACSNPPVSQTFASCRKPQNSEPSKLRMSVASQAWGVRLANFQRWVPSWPAASTWETMPRPPARVVSHSDERQPLRLVLQAQLDSIAPSLSRANALCTWRQPNRALATGRLAVQNAQAMQQDTCYCRDDSPNSYPSISCNNERCVSRMLGPQGSNRLHISGARAPRDRAR